MMPDFNQLGQQRRGSSQGGEEADTDVDTEEDPEEELQVVPQAAENLQVPQAPEKLPPQDCPLLSLLAKPIEPWGGLAREEPLNALDGRWRWGEALDAEILRSLARDTVGDEAEALDAKIHEALNEADEAELDDAWHLAGAAVSHRGLPIVFDFLEEERLFELALVEGAPVFYVGATQDPLRRWVGDPDGDEQRGTLPGHRNAGWNVMHVVHVAHGGAVASLEARLIREAMERHPSQCRNAVPDARGLSRRAINFVYVVV